MKTLKLVRSRITKIKADINHEFKGKLELKTNININSFEKIKELKDGLKISYNFEVKYGELGEIEVSGELYVMGDQKLIKELIKLQKDKNYNSQEYIEITNLILQKASIKALELEEELGLPIHLKLPKISVKN